jgi:predicted RNA-binding Zn-ribbon protein involved in translation (DUF1610 family)
MKARDGDAQAKIAPLESVRKTGGGKRAAGVCPSCKTEVPAKPGFRFASLKCPKCGALMGRQ